MKQRGFSLMEMMIVLLIVAIIAAASAPMVSKKMMRDAEGGSPWMYAGLGGSITYNPDGNQNKTAMIGASTTPTGASKAKLYIETSSSEPQIAIGRSGDAKVVKFMTWSGNNLCISDTKTESNQVSASTAMGYSAIAGPSSAAFGYNADARGGGATAIGGSTKAKGVDSTAVGYQSNANGSMSTSFGYNANASQTGCIAIGSSSKANSNYATALGASSNAFSLYSTAIGYSTKAGANATSIGYSANASGASATAVGYSSKAVSSTTAVGYSANANGSYSTAIGYSANASQSYSTALGSNAKASGSFSTALGYSSNASGSCALAAGYSSSATGFGSTALGYGSSATNSDATAVGLSTTASGMYSSAVGYKAEASHPFSTAIGYRAKTTTREQIVLGTSSTTVYIPGRLVVGYDVLLNAVKGDTALRRGNEGGELCVVRSEDLKGGDDNLRRYPTDIDNRSFFDSYISDRRLKNVGEVFSGGLDKVKQLKVYNFTFKDDESKTPHVGVMAQDLQKVFPDAVTKGKDGFLRIRWEDMFYSLVNAVKELDLRITTENTELKKRVTELEKENKELEKRLSKLELKVY